MFQRILVPLDGSTVSFYALDYAIQIAANEQAVVTTLCVVDSRVIHEARLYLPMQDTIGVSVEVEPSTKVASVYQAWAEQVTAQARARGEAAGVEIKPQIVTGIPYREIISSSLSHDLLVIATWNNQKDYPGPFLAGNTLWYVIQQTQLPSLCVFCPPTNLQTVLVAYDGSRAAQDALQLAVTWAQVWNLTFLVLTVQQNGHQAQTLLHEARLRTRPLTPRLIAREGDPREAISIVATDFQCDLIALGVHSNRFFGGHSLGHVTDTLLRIGHQPMLLSH